MQAPGTGSTRQASDHPPDLTLALRLGQSRFWQMMLRMGIRKLACDPFSQGKLVPTASRFSDISGVSPSAQ